MTTQIIGRIYKITSSECEGVYIGSTTQQLKTRFSKHKSDYKRYLDDRTNSNYMTSFEIIKHADAKIELIHEGIFKDKKCLEKMEGELIKTTSCCVNKIICGRTNQESKRLSYEKYKDKYKEFYEANKDTLCKRQKEYNEAKKDKLKSVRHIKALEQLSQD